MTRCETLQKILDEAHEEGNGPLVDAMEAAMAAAGCGAASASSDSGGGGHGDPDPDGG